MSTIVHFDVPAEDIKRAKKFYETIFDWEITPVPGPMEYYHIITRDAEGNKGLAGGMGKRGAPEQHITNYIDVKPIEEYIQKIKNQGGKILMPKTPIPGFGYLATFQDTEGNTIGLWETDPQTQVNESSV